MSEGLKYDNGKPRMDLLDPTFTIGVANVLTFGASKYAADNWRNGIKYTRIISAIHRHLAAIQSGEDIDPESGLPHIYHIGCNCQFLGWMMQNKPEFDDRWKPPVERIKEIPGLFNHIEFDNEGKMIFKGFQVDANTK